MNVVFQFFAVLAGILVICVYFLGLAWIIRWLIRQLFKKDK